MVIYRLETLITALLLMLGSTDFTESTPSTPPPSTNQGKTHPSQPLELNTVTVGSFKTSIKWKFNGDFDRLEVNNTASGANMSFTIDDVASSSFDFFFGTISGLTPSTDYAVQLIAVKHEIYGIPSPLSFCTNSDKPKNCTCSQRTNSSVHLKWKNGTGPYKQFTVNNVGKGKSFESDEELTPGEMKSFSITSVPTCENVIRQSHPCIVNVAALPPDPTNVVIEDNKSTSVNIRWNKKGGTVDSYEIVVKHINGTIFKKYSTTGQKLPITGLAPATQYNVEVRSVRVETGGCEDDDGDKILYSVDNASWTFYTRPNAPTGPLNIENVNVNGFTVNWQESSSSYSYYHVVVKAYRNESDTHIKNTTGVSLISGYDSVSFDGLTSGRLYTIKVYTVLEGLMSEQAAENSSYTVPTMPDFIQIKEIKSTSIIFTMIPTGAEFINWHVNVVNVMRPGFIDVYTFSNTTTTGTVTDLWPGTEYIIEYVVSVPGHDSKKTQPTINYTVTPGVNPSSVIIDATTPNSMTITWSPPSAGNTSAYSYNVTFSCTSPNGHRNTTVYPRDVDGTRASIDSLDPGSKCTVFITARIGNQTTERTEKQLKQTTNETAPGTVREIKTTKIQSTSFVISWKDPTLRNGVIRRYDMLIASYKPDTCEPGDPDNTTSVECTRRIVYNCEGCTPVPSNGIQGRQINIECAGSNQNNFSKDQTDFKHTIVNLHPYMKYKVTIIPYTVTHGEENSVMQLTAEDRPTESPQDLTVTSTTAESIELSWKPPSCGKRNGNIAEFRVSSYYKTHVCTDILTSITQHETETKHVQGDVLTTKLEGLYSFWDYRIVILASTNKGSGYWSPFIDQRTNSSVPSEVRHLKVTKVSTESLDIKWTQPCYPNGIVNNYTIVTTNLENNSTMSTTSTDDKTQFQISPLLPYRNYTVVVWANVIGYQGKKSSPFNCTTSIGLPDIPTFVNATSVTSSIIYVEWDVKIYTGPTTFYVKAKASDAEHKGCSPIPDFHARTCNITDLLQYKNYTITIDAITEAGSSSAKETRIVQTLQAEPGNVTSLLVISQHDVLLPRSIYVQWDPPRKVDQNGILIGYVIEAQAKYRNGQFKTYQRCILNGTSGSEHCETNKIEVRCSKPELNSTTWKCNMTKEVSTGAYIVVVSAITAPGNGSKSYQDTTVPPGAPLKPKENASYPLVKPAGVSVSEPEYQIAVAFAREFLCGTTNGDIVDWGVVVAEANKVIGGEPFIGTKSLFSSHKRSYKTWSQVYGEDIDMLPYIASPVTWRPCEGFRGNISTSPWSLSPVIFIAGENTGCSETASQQTCNGKLVPEKNYRVKAYACTDGGCTETEYSAPISTGMDEADDDKGHWSYHYNKATPIALIAGVVLAILAVLVVIGVTIVLQRRRMLEELNNLSGGLSVNEKCIQLEQLYIGNQRARQGHQNTNISKCFRKDNPNTEDVLECSTLHKDTKDFKNRIDINGSISRKEFPMYVDILKENYYMVLDDVFKLLKEESPRYPRTFGEQPTNMPKNRYANILPFDHSRVKLLQTDTNDSDYINSNYISGLVSNYIATQGPLPATINDFWRMTLEQNVDTIVMLTKEIENGQRKCECYWTKLNEKQFYGNIEVSVRAELDFEEFTMRRIEVRSKSVVREVCHIQYLKWPETGLPSDPKSFADFVEVVRELTKTGPVVPSNVIVHCSAGIGVTGIFIAVDHLLQHLRNHDSVNIYKLVQKMRECRGNIVQTKEQYLFIHECVNYAICSKEQYIEATCAKEITEEFDDERNVVKDDNYEMVTF